LDKKIRHFGGAFQDFLDTAALCDSMDLVISVDTSVAHLAGALGKPTWIMLPHNSDWRWLLEREDSPWYPSVKLYRKTTVGSWDPIMKRIQSDLKGIELKTD
jgi:ADP-heptose:LPS heptosyltransferase